MKMENFREFTKQFEGEYSEENKELVREFLIKENAKKEVQPALMLGINNRPVISYFSIKQYKEMANKRLSDPLADKQSVIRDLLNSYVYTPLKGNGSVCEMLYKRIKASRTKPSNVDFSYYSRTLAIEELIKFESFLLSGCENEIEQKEITLRDFFINTDAEQLKEVKTTFSSYYGKDLARVIYLLLKNEKLNITKSSTSKGLTAFLRAFANMNKKQIEAVRKNFDAGSTINYDLKDANDLDETGIDQKIKEIYKVG